MPMRTTYDTFTVATMINRAMTDQLIKKEIMLVEDIYTPIDETKFLSLDDTVFQYRNLNTKAPIHGSRSSAQHATCGHHNCEGYPWKQIRFRLNG